MLHPTDKNGIKDPTSEAVQCWEKYRSNENTLLDELRTIFEKHSMLFDAARQRLVPATRGLDKPPPNIFWNFIPHAARVIGAEPPNWRWEECTRKADSRLRPFHVPSSCEEMHARIQLEGRSEQQPSSAKPDLGLSGGAIEPARRALYD